MSIKQKPQNKFSIIWLFCFVIFVFLPMLHAQASNALNAAKSGLNESAVCGFGDPSSCAGQNTQQQVAATGLMISLPGALGKVIGVVLSFIGALFLILMIYAGILWMTARGNEQQVTKAKDLIYAAIIGLVIVMAAYAITAFIGDQLTTR